MGEMIEYLLKERATAAGIGAKTPKKEKEKIARRETHIYV